jgi:hypothetical protein
MKLVDCCEALNYGLQGIILDNKDYLRGIENG